MAVTLGVRAPVKRNRLLMMKKINELYAKNIADLSKVVLEDPE